MKIGKCLIGIYIIANVVIIHDANGKAGDILINKQERWLESGKPWTLSEDYTLIITIVDRERVFVSLSKSGDLIHSKGVYLENPYRYTDNKTGQEILYFYVQNINNNKTRIVSIFQYSEGSSSFKSTPLPFSIPTPIPGLNLVADRKTLLKGEVWKMGRGWELKANSIDSKAKQVGLVIFKNGIKLDEKRIAEGLYYDFQKNFSTKIEHIFTQSGVDFVSLTDTYISPEDTQTFIPDPTNNLQQDTLKNDEIFNPFNNYILDITILTIMVTLYMLFALKYWK
ncbi:MAG: hypothetical protein J5U19_15220 [Candidatus Methanoperedens sp.]|nr:hypothetical protein [Candidatus Methanoperedens sp.]